MLEGKTALITGATGGIGAAVARELADKGCHLVINGFGEADEIEALRRELAGRSGGDAIYSDADLADQAGIEALADQALQRFSTVDILVNNAVVRDFAPVEAFSSEAWERGMAVNLSAAFYLIRRVLPGMRAQNWGRIINMSSVFGLFATRDRVAYVTTKTALIGLTRAVALETSETDITCNALCPGTVHTEAIEQRLQTMASDAGIDRDSAVERFLATRQPGGKFVKAENVAAMAGFLCGPGGADITGTALPLDHGWSIC